MTDDDTEARIRLLEAHMDDALVEVTSAIREALVAGKQQRRRTQPEISFEDNGLPRLSDGSPFSPNGGFEWAAVLDPPYNASQEVREAGRYPLARFPALARLKSFIEAHAEHLPPVQGIRQPLLGVHVQIDLETVVDAYFDRFEMREATARERAYLLAPRLIPYRATQLPIALVVPIALVRFGCDRFRLSPSTLIVRMSDALQRARWASKAWGAKGHDSVLAAATHAIVLKGWTVENEPGYGLAHSLGRRADTTALAIDRVFAALRLVTGIETGYAQEIRLARGWRLHQRAGWPEIYAVGARRYPEHFDDYGWQREDPPLIDARQLEEIARVHRSLTGDLNDRLDLALRRLNTAMTRAEPADGLLDATIALEVLLGDTSEAVSWKLRMRAAALVGRNQPIEEVKATFEAVKAIYAARSAIVHGSTGKSARTDIRAARGKAIDLVRQLILILLDAPQFLNPDRIDQDLLLGQEPGGVFGPARLRPDGPGAEVDA